MRGIKLKKKMSDQLPFKKDNSKCGRHESSDLPKMFELFGHSNILLSRRTYGRKGTDKRLSLPSESLFVGELYVEENSESAIDITSSSMSKNKDNEKGINSDFSLFNDEHIDYFSVPADSSKHNSSPLSDPEASSSGSNYMHTWKNLEDQINNQQDSSVESSESIIYVGTFKRVRDANESKSACNFSCPPVSSGFSLKSLPYSIVDLVKRFSESNNQAHAKNKDCKSIPAKKVSVVKNVISSKRNSFGKKTWNCRASVKKAKNVLLKRNMMSTRIPDTKINSGVKKGVAKTPSKSVQKGNNRSIDNVERNVAMDCVNNTDVLKKVDATISKAVQKEHIRSVDSVEKSIDMIGSINNVGVLRKGGDKTPLKTVLEGNNECVSRKKLCRNKAITKIKCQSSSSHGTAEKMHDADKQIEKPSLILCNGNAVLNPAFNNNPNIIVDSKFLPIIPLIKLPLFPTCKEDACEATLHSSKIASAAGNHSIQNDNQAVSIRNMEDLVIPGPSILSNNHSSKNGSEYDMENGLTSDSNNHACNSTTIYTCKNTIADVTNCTDELKPEHCVSPQKFRDSNSFEIFMADNLSAMRNTCALKYRENSAEILMATSLIDPSLQNCNMTLADFCLIPGVTDTYEVYLQMYGLNNPKVTLDSNKGYDFPENFETENLLRLIKDYVLTTFSYLIPNPEEVKANSIVLYSEIVAAAMCQMSKKELKFLLLVFGYEEWSFKVTDVVSKLGHLALIVLYCEYNYRQNPAFKT